MNPSLQQLAHQRQQYRDQISNNTNEDDPLAAYDQFVQWTLQNYTQNDPSSALRELLEEVTRKFKDDPSYKTDLRYLKLWLLYAREVESPATIYAFLLANEIGTNYSLLYEEYANVLEQAGFYTEAENVYHLGISRNPRALSRLTSRFKEFQNRSASFPARALSTPKSLSSIYKPIPQLDSLHQGNHSPQSTSSSRYALMLAPPVPGKRPEKLRFNLSLLFTEEGKEYSVQEARARSMGLLGKKWGPPPASELNHNVPSSSTSTQVNVNADRRKSDRNTTNTRSRGLVAGEPTVTINTKEALADVFGMYNSPEKTVRSAQIPGSKHAPLKKVEPVTPVVRQVQVQAKSENAGQVSKTTTFRPYVDDNAGRKENVTPALKSRPLVDLESSISSTTTEGRRALSIKESSLPSSNSNENAVKGVSKFKPSAVVKSAAENDNADSLFSKVFTPASSQPLREVRKDDHKKPQSPPQDLLSPTNNTSQTSMLSSNTSSTFTPFVDAVFTRPSSQNVNASVKPGAFRPVSSRKTGSTSSAPQSQSGHHQPLQFSNTIEIDAEGNHDEEQSPFYSPIEDIQLPTGDREYENAEPFQTAPLRGRFGQFNVMTPITERTFEFTASSHMSAFGTPSETSSIFDGGKGFGQQDEWDAFQAAEQLAAELREEEQDDGDLLSQDSFEDSDSSFMPAGDDSEPLGLGDEVSGIVESIEEKTGTLSLVDALTVSSKFKPPNPCNPFDPPVLVTLLSLFPSDEGYHYFRDREANMLDGLRKFAKKARKLSGDTTSTGVFNLSLSFPLSLGDRRFNVVGKLGEGGFGTVFQAKEPRRNNSAEDEAEEDEDEDASMVALKVVKPRNVWEYHVLRRLHCALPVHLRRSVVLPHALYAFKDECFLVLELCSQGSLLDIVNNAGPAGVSQQGACLDELLVMFFTIELLRLVVGMHSVGFIHGDLKIDNCLLRLEDISGGASAWSSLYQPSGKGGWDHKGIKLIDFGRTIDTRLFPAGQKFIAEWPTDDRDCLEMREGQSWTFQTDYFGLAGIIYCMLFGKYIQSASVTASPEGYKIATPFKRYWQNDLWDRLFHVLLNPDLVHPDGRLPVNEQLETLREEMETWLQSNCNRSSNTLKGLLKKVEVAAWQGSTR